MEFDVAVIGGGDVGCAVLFELTNHGYNCVLTEKNDSLVSEASSGNSGMLHTGFDAVGMELDCIKICQTRVFDIAAKLGVPVNHIGATMVAWNDMQLSQLPEIADRSRVAGVSAFHLWRASELYKREPQLHQGALGALYIPGEAVTDPWLLPVLMANSAHSKKAQIWLNAQVLSCTREDHWTEVETTRGRVRARCVVNCAGLYGDIIDNLAGQSNFSILPRKGQYTIYDKTAQDLIHSSILPVPSKVGKGVIIFRSVYNNVVVGPTAENVESRQQAPVDDHITKRLQTVTRQTVRDLDSHRVMAHYTGVRPATQYKDYIIKTNKDRNWITVGGIRSTGLSGCLGISDKVHHQVEEILAIEPCRGEDSTLSKPELQFTRYGTAIVDGFEHKITHPITQFGTGDILCKL